MSFILNVNASSHFEGDDVNEGNIFNFLYFFMLKTVNLLIYNRYQKFKKRNICLNTIKIKLNI